MILPRAQSAPLADVDRRGRLTNQISGWGLKLTVTLALLLPLCAALAAWLSVSRNIDWLSSLSYFRHDGWCQELQEGWRGHCWGDYGAIRFDSLLTPPSGPEAVYPMSSRILRLPFAFIDGQAGYNAGLIAFLAVSAACLIVPACWASWHMAWPLRIAVILSTAVLTVPFIVVMDRGNAIGLVVPALLCFAVSLTRGRLWWVAVAVVVASSVKPQFAILALSLIALRAWRPFVVTLVGAISVAIVPYGLLGADAVRGAADWVREALAWSRSQSLSVDWPTNLSLPKAVFDWSALVVRPSAGDEGSPRSLAIKVVEGSSLLLAGVLVAGVLLVLCLKGQRVPPLLVGVALMAVASLSSSLTFQYYSVFVLVVVALIIRPSTHADDMWSLPGARTTLVLLSAATALSLSPLVVPRDIVGSSPDGSVVSSWTPLIASTLWLGFLLSLAVATMRTVRLDRPPRAADRAAPTAP